MVYVVGKSLQVFPPKRQASVSRQFCAIPVEPQCLMLMPTVFTGQINYFHNKRI